MESTDPLKKLKKDKSDSSSSDIPLEEEELKGFLSEPETTLPVKRKSPYQSLDGFHNIFNLEISS